MANHTLSVESLYLPVGESLFHKYFLALSIALPVCVVLGCVLGLFGLCKCSYKVVALMATGVVIKLALIPDVEDDLVEKKQPEGTNDEGNSDMQSNHESGETAQNGTPDQNFQNGTVDETDQLCKHKDRVAFTTGSGSPGEPYIVHRCAPVFLLPLAALLIAAYASVIITAQWTITTRCPIVGTDNDSSICYSGLCNPPVDCAAWKNAGMQDELICVANSTAFDPFNPLERFVSLLAVQVAVLQFFACIINKGCCIKGCRDPPTRYSAICALDLLFILLVSFATGYVWRTQTDREDTFEKLTIPFTHLIAVSLAECLILFVFTCLLCCEECRKCKMDCNWMAERRRQNAQTPTQSERQCNGPPSNTEENSTTNDTPQAEATRTHQLESGDDNDLILRDPTSPHPFSPPESSSTQTRGTNPTETSASEGTDNP